MPSNEASAPSGLIVTLQGGNADAGWRFLSQYWEAIAEEENMIIALPSGYTYGDDEAAWVLNTEATSMQDIKFFNEMIADISVRHFVDLSRVYGVSTPLVLCSRMSWHVIWGRVLRLSRHLLALCL